MQKKAILWIFVLLFMLIGLAPVLTLVIKSFIVDGTFSFKNYLGLFQTKREWVLFFNSISLSLCTVFLTLFLGVPLGILFTKTNLPLRNVFPFLFLIPLIIPPYILAVGWFYFLGRSGIISNIVGDSMGAYTSGLLFGFPGTLFIMVSVFLPVVIILTMTYLRMINPSLEEAARLSGGWLLVLRRISLPIIVPGICLASIIVFILTMGELGVPSFLRFEVFPVEAFTQFSAFYNFEAATAAAIPLGIITLFIIITERIFLSRKTFHFRIVKKPLLRIPLGKMKPFFLLIVCLLLVIFAVIPTGVLLAKSRFLWAYKEALARSADSIFCSLSYATLGQQVW